MVAIKLLKINHADGFSINTISMSLTVGFRLLTLPAISISSQYGDKISLTFSAIVVASSNLIVSLPSLLFDSPYFLLTCLSNSFSILQISQGLLDFGQK